MNVLILIGSSSKNSHSYSLGEYVREILNYSENIQVQMVTLNNLKLPFANPNYHSSLEKIKDENVQYLLSSLIFLDGIVLISPNYHGTFSGILKNTLDILNTKYISNKPIGIMTNSDGMKSTEPITQLRAVIRSLNGYSIPAQVATSDEDYIKENNLYILKNEENKQRTAIFVEQLIHFIKQLS
ncbi:NADPH-dependent FMN reductase [Staphylococcus cohnii]|uniref:NADPH-dependent FMN reductase n=1 Tax=Staphylococcus cohnii TaxID=29382 RepID=UPI00374F07A9